MSYATENAVDAERLSEQQIKHVQNIRERFIDSLDKYFSDMCRDITIENAKNGDEKSQLILERKSIKW